MKTSLVRIGNSRGVRIPKTVIDQCGLAGIVELTVQDDKIVIAKARSPREGWDEAFERIAAEGEDELLLPDVGMTGWEDDEWQW